MQNAQNKECDGKMPTKCRKRAKTTKFSKNVKNPVQNAKNTIKCKECGNKTPKSVKNAGKCIGKCKISVTTGD